MKRLKYFHSLPQKEINKLVESKMKIGELIEKYKQPKWCGYPEALSGKWGCWALMDLSENGGRTKISKEFCKSCDCYLAGFTK